MNSNDHKREESSDSDYWSVDEEWCDNFDFPDDGGAEEDDFDGVNALILEVNDQHDFRTAVIESSDERVSTNMWR